MKEKTGNSGSQAGTVTGNSAGMDWMGILEQDWLGTTHRWDMMVKRGIPHLDWTGTATVHWAVEWTGILMGLRGILPAWTGL